MGIAAKTLRGGIRLYQLFLSYFTVGSCRYVPSCSEYAMEAIATHGAVKGGWLGFARILRCNPWGGEGYDPVPPAVCGGTACSHSPIHSHSHDAASPQAGAR